MITLVRHAESAANAGHRTDSPDGIALTERGTRQAEDLAKNWPSPPMNVLSSPYDRALQTAKPLAARFSLPITLVSAQEFTYLSPSRCTGTTVDDRRSWVADYWETCDPDFRDGTGAETFREFVERVETTMSKLTSLPLQNSVVFCHGQYMQMVRWRQAAPAKLLDGEAMREFRLLDLQNPIQHCEQVRIRGF